MPYRRPVAALGLLVGLIAAGCGDDKAQPDHMSLPGEVLRVNPDPDPRVMAWAGCLDAVTQCLETGGAVRTCTTAASCGPRCVTALDRALEGASGREAELDAFEEVFVAPGAVCRPVERAAP
jgi:hypothetical protein